MIEQMDYVKKKGNIMLALNISHHSNSYELAGAFLNFHYPQIILWHIVDNNDFERTINKILFHSPEIILLPDNSNTYSSQLMELKKTITHEFQKIQIISLPSIYFCEIYGYKILKIYGIDEIDTLTKKSEKRISCLATVSAIFYYIFHVKELIYNPNSISIEFRNEADYVQLDYQTLCVVGLSSFKYVSCTSHNLYKTINKCTTFFGKKLLHESLMQPFYNQNSIELRQTAVFELVSNAEKRYFLQEVMRRFINVHKLLSIESKFKYFGKNIKTDNNLDIILNFDYFLKTFPEMLKFTEGLSSEIFVNTSEVFSDDCYKSIRSLISSILRKDTFFPQNYISSLIQRCFAIKTQISELLDILRIAYCEITDKMIDYVNHLSHEYSLSLALGCNKKYGYHIQMKSNIQKKLDFPKISKIFTILKENDASIIMTTKKLMVDNQTCKEICEEICIISNVLLEGLIEKLQNHKKPLMKVCNYIAELDFISCISEISSQNGFVKPIFGSQLYLIDSYHPLSFISGSEMCESNDIVSSVSHNFQIITGPILSGKTTYLEQVISSQILAQIGCYVPAKFAMFRLSDRIFYHNSSNMQQLKKFESEIYELNHICDSLTSRSIVVIDEPLPNILNVEGKSILMALCLRLSSSTAFTFCATLHSCLLDISNDIMNITSLYFDSNYPQANKENQSSCKIKVGVKKCPTRSAFIINFTNIPESFTCETLQKVKHTGDFWNLRQNEDPILANSYQSVPHKIYNIMAKLYHHLIIRIHFKNPIQMIPRELIYKIFFYNERNNLEKTIYSKYNETYEQLRYRNNFVSSIINIIISLKQVEFLEYISSQNMISSTNKSSLIIKSDCIQKKSNTILRKRLRSYKIINTSNESNSKITHEKNIFEYVNVANSTFPSCRNLRDFKIDMYLHNLYTNMINCTLMNYTLFK